MTSKKTLFLKAFLKKPSIVGSIAPSSPQVANAMTDHPKLKQANCIVEIGPGTGPVTEMILAKKNPNTCFFAIEKNEDFRETLIQKFPNLPIYYDDAQNIQTYLHKHQCEKCDLIISGLPWTLLPTPIQFKILEKISNSLSDDGVLIQLCCLHSKIFPSFHRFKKLLNQNFNITYSKTIRNKAGIHTAFLIYARKKPS